MIEPIINDAAYTTRLLLITAVAVDSMFCIWSLRQLFRHLDKREPFQAAGGFLVFVLFIGLLISALVPLIQ